MFPTDSKALLQESDDSDGDLSSSIDFNYDEKVEESDPVDNVPTPDTNLHTMKEEPDNRTSYGYPNPSRIPPPTSNQFTCEDPNNSDSLGTIESIFENVLISSVPPVDIDETNTIQPPSVNKALYNGDIRSSPVISNTNRMNVDSGPSIKAENDQISGNPVSQVSSNKTNMESAVSNNSSNNTYPVNPIWKSRKITLGKRKVLSCDICNIVFHYKKDLSTHLLKIHDVKLFSCDICQKRFTYRHSLERHKSVHTGVKPYSCDVCQKRFVERHSLKRHKNVHSGVRTFACDICPLKFVQRHSLTRHKSVHDGGKPYGCNTCEKRFAHRASVSRHKCVLAADVTNKKNELTNGDGSLSVRYPLLNARNPLNGLNPNYGKPVSPAAFKNHESGYDADLHDTNENNFSERSDMESDTVANN